MRFERTERGLTLIELMVALTVLGILLAVAVPSFRGAALSSKLVAISGDLYASAQLARGEAIKRNQIVTVCASSDGSTCTGTWSDGWVVRDADGNVLQVETAIADGYEVAESSALVNLSFRPVGAGATAALFKVCRSDPVGPEERVVSITATGMPYIGRTESGTCP